MMLLSLLKRSNWLFLTAVVLAACSPSGVSSTPEQALATPLSSATPTLSPSQTAEPTQPSPTEVAEPTEETTLPETPPNPNRTVEVIRVVVSGEAGSYNFSVQVSSPDEGCQQYADWWEVLTPNGELVYRRILLHSHVNEQPFTRSGGPVPIEADQVVIVRAHMNPDGYGESAMQGSPAGGFTPIDLDPAEFAPLEAMPPLPDGCNF